LGVDDPDARAVASKRECYTEATSVKRHTERVIPRFVGRVASGVRRKTLGPRVRGDDAIIVAPAKAGAQVRCCADL